MTTDCIIENWIIKNKTWLGFLFGILGVWVVSVIGLMLFKCIRSDLLWNASRISLSNILSLGSAIGAIAVAVLAFVAFRYATKQYKKQKTIDVSIECIKQVLSLLFFHKSKLTTKFDRLNNIYLNSIENLKITNTPSTPNICPPKDVKALQAHLENIKDEVNNFTNDWFKIIGTQLTLLNKIKPTPTFISIKTKIDTSIDKIHICFNSINTYNPDESIDLLYSDGILIMNEIHNLHEEVLKYFENILELDKYHHDQP